jgi:hypothetical protein
MWCDHPYLDQGGREFSRSAISNEALSLTPVVPIPDFIEAAELQAQSEGRRCTAWSRPVSMLQVLRFSLVSVFVFVGRMKLLSRYS